MAAGAIMESPAVATDGIGAAESPAAAESVAPGANVGGSMGFKERI